MLVRSGNQDRTEVQADLRLQFVCKSFENTLGKGKITHNEQFLLSHSVFYPFGEFSSVFIKVEIVVGKLFQSGRV